MKIALLGYGKMGREIEAIALERNHRIVLIIDADNQQDFTIPNLKKADVAIDFSTPANAFSNIMRCFEAGVPVVCGTTGWLDRMEEARESCRKQNQTFFHASNFSLGVNIFFAVNRYLARIMDSYDGYDVSIKEIHHVHKLDAPSGTAISIARDIISGVSRKQKWELNRSSDSTVIPINAERHNEVPGTHIITWDSDADSIVMTHEAKSRKGFALGAVLAAEFIRDKKGVYGMQDMLRIS